MPLLPQHSSTLSLSSFFTCTTFSRSVSPPVSLSPSLFLEQEKEPEPEKEREAEREIYFTDSRPLESPSSSSSSSSRPASPVKTWCLFRPTLVPLNPFCSRVPRATGSPLAAACVCVWLFFVCDCDRVFVRTF